LSKGYTIVICYFSAKHTTLRRKIKRNQDWVGWHVYSWTVVSAS